MDLFTLPFIFAIKAGVLIGFALAYSKFRGIARRIKPKTRTAVCVLYALWAASLIGFNIYVLIEIMPLELQLPLAVLLASTVAGSAMLYHYFLLKLVNSARIHRFAVKLRAARIKSRTNKQSRLHWI